MMHFQQSTMPSSTPVGTLGGCNRHTRIIFLYPQTPIGTHFPRTGDPPVALTTMRQYFRAP